MQLGTMGSNAASERERKQNPTCVVEADGIAATLDGAQSRAGPDLCWNVDRN